MRHQGPINIKTKEKTTAGQAKSTDYWNKKLQVQSEKDSSNSTFFTKSSTLLVENSRKTKFLHSFCQEQNANLLPFFVYACRLG